MGLLIDANVWIEYERGRFDLPDFLSTRMEEPVAIATIIASELLAGVHRGSVPLKREKRRLTVEAILKRVSVIPFDLPIARLHAVLLPEIESQGRKIGSHDLIIAATALFLDYALVSFDTRGFQSIPGLRMINPAS